MEAGPVSKVWHSSGWRDPVGPWHYGHCYGRDQPISVSLMLVVAPVLIGVLYTVLMSLLREPTRRRFNAIMVAGAGAAYLSSGSFMPWEFVFTAAVTYCAYRGLDSYVWIGVAWLLHAAWDVLHYLRGPPIIPFASHSSLGCAICDPVIAIWCLRGGPSLPRLINSWFSRHRASASDPTGS